ncbi:MAG: hypothetical protein JJU28_05805 [Cyclobacteriaceae bacterium]|nr:hypothetical protein [Cyclobacteriaceae bacterium]
MRSKTKDYHSLNAILMCMLALLMLNCQSKNGKDVGEPGNVDFIKGVYGNPGALLDAGYNFEELGMNAVFVRSISLNFDFYKTAREQKCKIFVEFPTLNGKNYLQNHPEAWPIDEKGEQSPPADWFMGICPTDPDFKEFRINQLKEILNSYQVDGIFLDYFHWHAQFETNNPILPETCFCNRCITTFSESKDIEIPEGDTPSRANWILSHSDTAWRDWRSSVLTNWARDMKTIIQDLQPDALMGIFYCSWYPGDHEAALYRSLGIDIHAIASEADVLAPMLFHKMKDRQPAWVGEYIHWLAEYLSKSENAKPLIWPIVQSHNNPANVSPEEFKEVMREGMKAPASGIMMFSDQSLLENPEKLEVMREIYQH